MGVVPLAAASTPTPKQSVLYDLHRLRWGQFYHLAALGKGGVTQRVSTVRALHHAVLNYLGRCLPLARAVLVFGSLGACFLAAPTTPVTLVWSVRLEERRCITALLVISQLLMQGFKLAL
jgi:hypothetical protein